MITPRRTRLVRVADLQAFRHTLVRLSLDGDPGRRASRLVIVPTRGAAGQLRRTMSTMSTISTGGDAPDLVTREQFYERVHARLASPPRLLTAYERDVMIRAAARSASPASRALRPGLIAEILRFYDQLRRQSRTVRRFEELLEETLVAEAESDRGAAKMLAQTRFLAAAFRGYEHRVMESGACDEHALRDRLLVEASANPIRDVIVSVGDWIADPDGLYLADFDLLTRLPGTETVDVVVTDGLLATGFHQRIHEWLPGIEEVADPATGTDPATSFVFVRRDREEELIAVARRVAVEASPRDSLDRVAVVYKRPLPYLYLAPAVFGGARIPYQTVDGFPLAAEPFAAALDLVFEFVESGFTRRSIVALLRSPHFAFQEEGRSFGAEEVAALDRGLSERRYFGGRDRLIELAGSWRGEERARLALAAACAAAEQLAPLLSPGPASAALRLLLTFIDAHAPQKGVRPLFELFEQPRSLQARTAIRRSLESLADAHAAHDDPVLSFAELTASVRRFLEEQTLSPESSDVGVQLADDQAARYGNFDDMAVVGLIEGEWPERARRNIFYPPSLLASLGWPSERDRRAAAEWRFLELLASPSRRVTVSTVTLEDDALVEPSTFLDAIPRASLPAGTLPDPLPASSLFTDEILAADPVGTIDRDALDPDTREWLAMRLARSSKDDPAFHGQTGSIDPRAWSVTALETYLGCPFKFFAQHVLRLEEEPEDEEVMNPRARGQFVHEVFQVFFERWQAEGYRAIVPANLEHARRMFAEVVDEHLTALPDAEAALERTRLLGGPTAAGLGETVLRMEAERPTAVIGRLLEYRLDGDFLFQTDRGPRRLALRGKADRVDLLEDGTFRLIDYKLGWPPKGTTALQLPVYGLCLEQRLDGHLGRRWTLGEAAYLAFRGPKRIVPLTADPADRGKALAAAQDQLLAAVDGITRGDFPPRPDDLFRCETCSYAAVCRKDYVGDV